jgi:branched-chain amino acid transport system substrate-binding protein
MKRKEIVGKGAVCLIAAVLLVTLTLIPIVEAQAQEAYKVGAVFSITGRASFLGDPEKKTAMMLAEQINTAGGINGHPLELVVYDDEGDPTKCALAVRKLITQDKVCAIVGPSLSGFSLAVLPEAEKHKIPLVSCAASYKIVNNEKTAIQVGLQGAPVRQHGGGGDLRPYEKERHQEDRPHDRHHRFWQKRPG